MQNTTDTGTTTAKPVATRRRGAIILATLATAAAAFSGTAAAADVESAHAAERGCPSYYCGSGNHNEVMASTRR